MRESHSTILELSDVEHTRAIGAALAHQLLSEPAASVVTLEGELGAGKTTLVSGFLHAAGWSGAVRSPTYTLIEPYELNGRRVHHIDLYRLAQPREVEGLGIRDLLGGCGVLLIEWPSRAGGAIPRPDLALWLEYGHRDADRRLRIDSFSAVGDKALDHIIAVERQKRAVSS